MFDEENKTNTDNSYTNLISVEQAAELSGFTPQHVRKLLRAGLLKGSKLGHIWVTTKDAIQEYLATERRTGPKTDS